MDKDALFERLYALLKDTAEVLAPNQEVNVVEAVFMSNLLTKWQDLCLESSGYSVEQFREWAQRTMGGA